MELVNVKILVKYLDANKNIFTFTQKTKKN